jgi:hypothetical protein
VADISANANTAYQGLSGAAQGLGTGVEGTGAQDDASKAQAVRQAMLGNFGALQNAQGRNATDYADTLATVVGPGQKLQAQAQGRRNTNAVRDQVASLGLQKGAYASKFSTDAITNEQKNVLAQQATRPGSCRRPRRRLRRTRPRARRLRPQRRLRRRWRRSTA